MATKDRVNKGDIAEIVGTSELVIESQRVDQRTITARRWRANLNDLSMQLGDHVTPSEAMLLRRAATLAFFCERDEALVMQGKPVDEEGYRRNVTSLGAVMVKLGLAAKSRDVTKRDARLYDAYAEAVKYAN